MNMRNIKTITLLPAIFIFVITTLTGCWGSTNTVETCVISTEQYRGKDALESALPPESFAAGQDIFASIRFIESPLGMEYTSKWYIDGEEVKSEEKEMTTDRSGIIVYSLTADEVTAGIMRFEILHGDDVLCSKELTVK